MSVASHEPIVLTIADGDTTSNALADVLSVGQHRVVRDNIVELSATLGSNDGATCSVQVQAKKSGTWVALNDASGTPVTVEEEAITVIPVSTFYDIRFVSASTESPATTINLVAQLAL